MEAKVPPPLVLLACAVVMYFLGHGGPRPHAWTAGLAILLALLGIGFAGPAVRRFRREGTTVNPLAVDRASSLVTSGPFRFTRNPMYLGMACLLAGWALWLGGWLPWLGVAAFVTWITWLQILPEERALRAKFGGDFDAYAARVRRWL